MLVDGRPVDPIAGRADDFRWPRPDAGVSAVKAEPDETSAETPGVRPVLAEPKNTKNAPR
jgi:hypothetical protein